MTYYFLSISLVFTNLLASVSLSLSLVLSLSRPLSLSLSCSLSLSLTHSLTHPPSLSLPKPMAMTPSERSPGTCRRTSLSLCGEKRGTRSTHTGPTPSNTRACGVDRALNSPAPSMRRRRLREPGGTCCYIPEQGVYIIYPNRVYIYTT